jgi:hypothetical protein
LGVALQLSCWAVVARLESGIRLGPHDAWRTKIGAYLCAMRWRSLAMRKRRGNRVNPSCMTVVWPLRHSGILRLGKAPYGSGLGLATSGTSGLCIELMRPRVETDLRLGKVNLPRR